MINQILLNRGVVMKKIGFIGLGNMGFFMSKNLALAGYEVNGFDLNENVFKELSPFNIYKRNSLEEISNQNDIIITMLPSGNSVKEVWTKVLNNIKPDTLIVDCSTIDIETSKKMHDLSRNKKILSLDAPVSGGTIGAENGSLTFMVGGQDEAYKKMLPLFQIMGNKAILCGEAGAGQATKLCNNLLLAITMVGLGESIKLADANKLDMEKFFDVISSSTGSCWALNNYCPINGIGPISPADDNFKPGFSSQLMLKDISLAINAANAGGIKLELGEIVVQKYKKMVEDNKGNLDFSAIIK